MSTAGPSALYAWLMGSSWSDVHPSVRRAHLSADRLDAHGSFRVTRGTRPLARLAGFVLRMPRAAEECPVSLHLRRMQNGERWYRRFDDTDLVTTQTEGPGRLLAERFGVLEFRFRLTPRVGALHYEQRAAGIRLGRLFVPLPAWAAPRVTACEAPGSDATRSAVSVAITAPGAGAIISFAGEIQVDGHGAS